MIADAVFLKPKPISHIYGNENAGVDRRGAPTRRLPLPRERPRSAEVHEKPWERDP